MQLKSYWATGMNTRFTLDRASFQNLLARASLAQEYLDSQKSTSPGVDLPSEPTVGKPSQEAVPPDYIHSLSAIVGVQRSIATHDVDVDGAMALIAEQARNVANADGVAIGLLEGDNLVYRAGSGGAAAYIGRYVKATLSISPASGEILRVESAQTDARLEAAICRQLGAKALLIVPICRGREVVGAVEILFSDAHVFQDREVRTYQLMARLVAEALSHTTQLELEQILPADEQKEHAQLTAAHGATEAEQGELLIFRRSAEVAAMIAQGAKRLLLHRYRWKAAVAVIVLVIASWVTYTHRPVSPVPNSAVLPRSNGFEQQPLPAAKLAANSTAKPQSAPVLIQEKKKVAGTAAQRRRVWRDVDYIAEDVTVRYVTLKPVVAPLQKRAIENTVQPGTKRVQPLQPPKAVPAPEKLEIKQISGQHKTCGQEHLGLGRSLVCWLHKIFPTHKLPNNSRKEWQTPDFPYIAEDPVW